MNKEKVLTNALVQFRSLDWGWRIQLHQTKSALSYWDGQVSNGDCGHAVLNRALSGKSMNKNFQSLWVCGVIIILINWLTSFLHSSYTSINPILDLFSNSSIDARMSTYFGTTSVNVCSGETRILVQRGQIERQYLKWN